MYSTANSSCEHIECDLNVWKMNRTGQPHVRYNNALLTDLFCGGAGAWTSGKDVSLSGELCTGDSGGGAGAALKPRPTGGGGGSGDDDCGSGAGGGLRWNSAADVLGFCGVDLVCSGLGGAGLLAAWFLCGRGGGGGWLSPGASGTKIMSTG